MDKGHRLELLNEIHAPEEWGTGEFVDEIKRLRALIKQAEFAGRYRDAHEQFAVCPWCHSSRDAGHEEICTAFITDGTVRLGEP